MKNIKKIVVILSLVVATVIILFLTNFNFFCLPQTYTLADGTEIEYHITKNGNCYVIEDFKFEKVAIPVGR